MLAISKLNFVLYIDTFMIINFVKTI